MKNIGLFITMLFAGTAAMAQQQFELPLWPDGSGENTAAVAQPSPAGSASTTDARLFVYLPAAGKATGQAVVICPGGGYAMLAIGNEGHQVAAWLNELGIAAVVVKYRMPAGNYSIPSKDVFKAIETTRQNAAQWNIKTDKVGVMGFSAGGHLASTAATHFTSPENRPDFAALIYPVITMDLQYTHNGSRVNLLGENPSEGLVAAFSNELRVSDNTPPVFIAFSDDDNLVPVQNATLFYNAMKARKRPAELHIFPTGDHGWGWRDNFKYANELRTSFERWLVEQMQ